VSGCDRFPLEQGRSDGTGDRGDRSEPKRQRSPEVPSPGRGLGKVVCGAVNPSANHASWSDLSALDLVCRGLRADHGQKHDPGDEISFRVDLNEGPLQEHYFGRFLTDMDLRQCDTVLVAAVRGS